jgi:hypothetical protein
VLTVTSPVVGGSPGIISTLNYPLPVT